MANKQTTRKQSAEWKRRMRKEKGKEAQVEGSEDVDIIVKTEDSLIDENETLGLIEKGTSTPNLTKKSKRLAGEIIWDSDHFPPSSKFQPPTKLPTVKSVMGRVRFLTKGKMQKELAIKQVSLEIESKYYHDTV